MVRPLLCVSIVLALSAVAQAQSPVGVFAGQSDVGRVRHAGAAAYDPQRQEYVISGRPGRVGTRDDFHFVWKRMSGSFLFTRALHGAGVEEHRKVG
jgi:hypothetical protein